MDVDSMWGARGRVAGDGGILTATMSTPVGLESLLQVREGYRQGRPCLRGTGITVHQVAAAHLMGLTSEEIRAENPDIDPSLFHAALAYYFANREQIEAELDEDDREGAALASKYPAGITAQTPHE